MKKENSHKGTKAQKILGVLVPWWLNYKGEKNDERKKTH
jgi:hypothetical protein